MISAREALERLQDGNRRFVSDAAARRVLSNASRRSELLEDQNPFAVILGCSDSRVPPEIVFDQGLGDLFVVRVAGNIASPTQVDSIAFAAQTFGARLIVVLGHSGCGAVLAAIEEFLQPTKKDSQNFRSILDPIRPSVEALLAKEPPLSRDDLVRQAVRANVRASANHLRKNLEILAIQREELLVVGAEYSLESGVVDFMDGVTS